MSKRSIMSDLARIDRMKDADIDYSDIPPLDKTFLNPTGIFEAKSVTQGQVSVAAREASPGPAIVPSLNLYPPRRLRR